MSGRYVPHPPTPTAQVQVGCYPGPSRAWGCGVNESSCRALGNQKPKVQKSGVRSGDVSRGDLGEDPGPGRLGGVKTRPDFGFLSLCVCVRVRVCGRVSVLTFFFSVLDLGT
jgi:hypothetical protein